MKYIVKYKSNKNWFWKTLNNVIGDGFVEGSNPSIRFFILEDYSRVEIACNDMVFAFGPDRAESIKKAKG